MDRIRQFISEIHRRSLWQVLSVYMVGSWVALQVVESISESAGLPDWAQPFALILLIIGLPIVLATAVVQEGRPGHGGSGVEGTPPSTAKDEPDRSANAEPSNQARIQGDSEKSGVRGRASGFRAFLTWKNAFSGGMAAFALLGIAVGGYFVMWSAGIGPVGSLAAQGVLSDRDRVVLADFHNATPDSLLSSVVTDALRIDLAASDAITLVETDAVRQGLARMQRDPHQTLTSELARELAVRDGMKAVLEGDVGAAGSGYILSATLRASESGETLASFRRTADSPEQVIQAIDKLSQDIREKAGESLRTIKRGAPLEEVTTTSLDALRKFTEAEQLFDIGDEAGSIALLEEAITLDSTFAMAHRKLAVTLSNMGIDRERQVEAYEAAFRFRDRLTERERLITEASYHNGITGDQDAIVRAYEGVLRIAPDDPSALNNLANVFNERDDFDRAAELYERAVNGPGTSNTAHSNLVRTRLLQGDMEGAGAALATFETAHPKDPNVVERGFWIPAWKGDWEEAEAMIARWEAAPELPFVYRVNAEWYRAQLATAQGKMEEARRHTAQAQRLAEGEFGPSPGWAYTLYGAYLESFVGNQDRARKILDALEAGDLFNQIPLSARDYGLAASSHNLMGDPEVGRAYLRRWEEEVPAELAGRYDETVRELLRGFEGGVAANPGRALSAIESYRARVRCRLCYRLQEAQALEAMGQAQDARDAWYGIATRFETNFTVSLVTRAGAWERVGYLSEEIGDAEAAVEGFRSFVELWADADAELQPRVQAARDRAASLEGARAAGSGDVGGS